MHVAARNQSQVTQLFSKKVVPGNIIYLVRNSSGKSAADVKKQKTKQNPTKKPNKTKQIINPKPKNPTRTT